jgi:serpin B
MVVIVPDDLAVFEDDVDAGTFSSVFGELSQPLASVTMPTFRFRSQVRLKDQLEALGMATPFTDQADFSAMTTAEPLQIADVVHEGFIAVDQEGTEAAAATAVVVQAVSAPAGERLVVDRPFLFAIRDDATGALVFLGRVTDPSATVD